MKKIGVITFSDTLDNYGQVLQCYALQELLKSLGHNPYVIQYVPKGAPIIERVIRNLSISRILDRLSNKGKKNKQILATLRAHNAELNRQREFEAFRSKYFATSDVIYHSIAELRNNPPQADIYITGSDQVWGGDIQSSNSAGWYLDFGNSSTKRISYAASMGRRHEELSNSSIFKRYMNKFDAVGVRESTALDACINNGYPEAKLVLDPTLLPTVELYKKLFAKISVSYDKPYIFLYILNIESKEELYWSSIHQYATSNNLDVKCVYSSGYIPARELIPENYGIQATVPEWLSLIHNSQLVITTSFHGIVFCIKMHKPFFAILINNGHSGGNIRITDLLGKLGLSNRIIDSKFSADNLSNTDMDWNTIDAKLEVLETISLQFLIDAIK